MSKVIKSTDIPRHNISDQGCHGQINKQKHEEQAREICCTVNSSKAFQRCVRLPFVLMAAALTVYVCILSSDRYFNFWVQTSIERTDLHVSEIDFPAVTICPSKLSKLNLSTTQDHAQFEKIFNLAQDVLWQTRDVAKATVPDFAQFSEYNGQLLQNLYQYFNFTCEEFFHECYWRRQMMRCCALFRRQGACYVFNTVRGQNTDPTWPWVVADAGPYSALNVRIRRQLPNLTVNSIGVILHEPDQYLASSIIYTTDDRIVVPVQPLRFTAEEDVRSRPVAMRHCYFPQELNRIGELRSDCIRNCNLRFIQKKCNCHYDTPLPLQQQQQELSSSSDGRRRCSLSDIPCFYQNRLSLYSMSNIIEESNESVFTTVDCGCYPNCDHTQYHFLAYTERCNTHETNSSFIVLDVYYQEETLFSYRSVLRFSLLDLMVSYGGIAGLFLGISLIGAIDAFLVCIGKLRHDDHEIRPSN
ncbi:pickpocket protein 19 isoform X2 [Scaptodrosophila lebanonensis]|uniref:Pickpocket protein 19 isoform X2 n=1 Tax=Drosophila lebanonensis TaxID=7225 RepID=A0A6J2T1K8_DROLE|nr:pickpocket protein 19 isoform X2 [Scaptodrosophila lebanonensis]